jgi:hypothetical protein
MTLYSTLRTALRNSALVALSEYPTSPVIFSHGPGGEPAESYVVINILSINQVGGHSTSTQTNTDEELSIRVPYEALVQLSFVGSSSGNMAYSFNQRINNNPLVLEELSKNKLGVMRKSQVRRAPQKRDTQWVEYHNMDVTFSYFVNTQQLVDVVEAVVIEAQIDEGIETAIIEILVPEDFVITP